MPNFNKILKLLGVPIKSLKLSLSEDSNLIVKSIKINQPIQDHDVTKFSKGIVNDSIARIVGKTFGLVWGLSVPLNYGDRNLGIIMYTKNSVTKFSDDEIRLLQLLNNQIAVSIINSKLYKSI